MEARISPLVVIVGPTASGKSALALEIAEKHNGEIICADSRTVYKGMDIGTAKPSKDEQTRVPHHLLDVVEPNQQFTVADFKECAQRAIGEITDRGKLPILVGGSGLYIDALLYDYGFAPQDAPRDPLNPRHLAPGTERPHKNMRENTLVLGLAPERSQLKQRIAERIELMVDAGFVDEVRLLMNRYPETPKALLAPGYKAFREHIEGHLSLEEAKNLFIRNDFQLAKRQMTWFRRNKSIHWLDDPREYVDLLTTLLNKNQI